MLLKGQDRTQTQLYTTYEDLISIDNPARAIDFILSNLIDENKTDYTNKGKSDEGRPAYPFSVMMKLYIYGLINNIKSSRSLERECHRNIELMWLMQGLKPDFKTISNFRAEQKEQISKFSKDYRIKLKTMGLIGKEFVIDGSKIKVNASRELLTRKSVMEQLSEMDKVLYDFLFEISHSRESGNP